MLPAIIVGKSYVQWGNGGYRGFHATEAHMGAYAKLFHLTGIKGAATHIFSVAAQLGSELLDVVCKFSNDGCKFVLRVERLFLAVLIVVVRLER